MEIGEGKLSSTSQTMSGEAADPTGTEVDGSHSEPPVIPPAPPPPPIDGVPMPPAFGMLLKIAHTTGT